jgi:hypothetical protein
METILHSDDPISPVGYLNFTKMHLEDKDQVRQLHSQVQMEPPLYLSAELGATCCGRSRIW